MDTTIGKRIAALRKEKALKQEELAEMLGVKREHIYCVGDNQNDIPMLAVSAQGFAPANCAKAVRDWGATVVCDCEDGAIADVIEILDKRYQE